MSAITAPVKLFAWVTKITLKDKSVLSDPGFFKSSLFEPGKEPFPVGSNKRLVLIELVYSRRLADNKDGGISAAFKDRRRLDGFVTGVKTLLTFVDCL